MIVVGLEGGGTTEVVAPPTAGAVVVRVALGVSQSQALGAVWGEESSQGRERRGVTTPKWLKRDSGARTMMVSLIKPPIVDELHFIHRKGILYSWRELSI